MENIEEFDTKVYGIKTSAEEKDKLQTAISKSPNFSIAAQEIAKIMGCEDIIARLNEYSIPCEIRIEGDWENKGTKNQSYNPYAIVNFYIRNADYKYYKTVLMSEFEAKKARIETNNQERKQQTTNKATINTDKLRDLIIILFLIIIGLIMIIVGIRGIANQEYDSGIMLIILGAFFFYCIIKFKKTNSEEERKNKRKR